MTHRRAAASPAAPAHRTSAPHRPPDSSAATLAIACACAAARALLVARTEQRFDRAHEALFARRPRFRDARIRRWRPIFASAALPLLDFFEEPQRLAEAHRLAPVGHRKRRIDLLRRAKRIDRVFVAEAMQPRDAAQKFRLRRGTAGVWEDTAPSGA